jgi:hypothetical protein
LKSTWSRSLGFLSLPILMTSVLYSCGGSGTPAGPNPTPTTPPVGGTPNGTATPAPAGTATPVPTPLVPDEDANPGPVASVFTRVFTAKASPSSLDYREGNGTSVPYYDEKSDTEIVLVGEFFIMDTTPKNAAGQKCQADRAPQWNVPAGGKLELLGVNGIGSNPFQFRSIARAKGVIPVYTVIDGVRSNIINVDIR